MVAFVAACDSDTIPPQDARVGYNYFPLQVGQYAVYAVEDIRYKFAQEPDTSYYQLKEVVADSFPGTGGEFIYDLKRYKRNTDTDVWQLDSVWNTRRNSNMAVVTENNVPLIKLVFPFKTALTWDGNALNSKSEQMYVLQPTSDKLKEEISSSLDSLLDLSLTVMQQESQDTIISYTQKLETYVENVGLFYKKSVSLQYCSSSTDCIGLGIIESGWRYRQTLIAYGKENQ